MRPPALALSSVLLAATAAACGGRAQVVLELGDAVPGATRVDVLLLEPVVMAREQRSNDPSQTATPTFETVFYMGERSRTTFALDGASTDGLQLEIRDAGGPYVPLVAVRGGDQLLALGLYDPDSVFAAELDRETTPHLVAPVSDLTIFPIRLEPVAREVLLASGPPRAVMRNEVMVVPCGADGAVSGFVWRRDEGAELRVLVPLPNRPGSRLDPPDLDCDQHSPGRGQIDRHDAGDQRDCDDTTFLVHGGGREVCSANPSIDEDCNPLTTLARGECPIGTCTSNLCACDDAGTQLCLDLYAAQPCRLPASSSGGSGLVPCDSAGPVKFQACTAGCEVVLLWAPDGLEVTISDDAGLPAVGLGRPLSLLDATAFLAVHATGPAKNAIEIVIARIKTSATTSTLAIPLQLVDVPCGSPSELLCPTL